MSSSQPQTNGVPASTAGTSQTIPNSQTTTGSQPPAASQSTTHTTPSTTAPRPRDARLVELLLTSQGVTSYEQRVPLLLLDFAYRHTSSVLSDALHLSGDPYVTHAGSKPSASSGATASAPGDASITANAVKLAIAARLSYQFRGGSAGGGISKDYMQELARERNKVALPKIVPNEWGVRLPSERFVLSGTSWGLKDIWHEAADEDEGGGDAMEGIEGPDLEDVGGDGVEGGTVDDVFGEDVDEEMAEQ
ncbi:transcription initiation factor IID, 31kD subunit-domain-containing protein [Thelonectria olida]|uniref:Transcription initiation factor IID, 31kD subunit-domain-containing protein n=1 Tax=Thelonectria olida TaxID=1576542 RepID=A0A9P9AWD1_9HYPO|nr:transcription initiation factor IID, 31kD subunit-domain-containing protein [Thelonectria olida]